MVVDDHGGEPWAVCGDSLHRDVVQSALETGSHRVLQLVSLAS